MRSKVSILGHFGRHANLLNGQTVKTKITSQEIKNQLGEDQVFEIDTAGGPKTLLKAPFQSFCALKKSDNVIIFPAHNGLRVYAPLLSFQRRFFKKRKLHYVVIGGWLPQFLQKRKKLAKILKKFDAIYVETNTMKTALEAQGFENIAVMTNFKKLTVLSENELDYTLDKTYRLCTFSRVMKEKGIETAIDVIKRINDGLGYTAYSLDIYGQVDSGQTEWFESLKGSFPEYICYCGSVDSSRSVEILKDYFALLFPTHFYTEGVPGTIIDAYAAGVPVISAKWESYADVVDDGVTGIGYEFDNEQQFEKILLDILRDEKKIFDMKINCVRKAREYSPEAAIQVLINKI